MDCFLIVLSGVCWIIAYIEIIRLGLKEKTYGMPFVALALNLAWEGIQSYLRLAKQDWSIQSLFILAWFILDLIILYTYLKYGQREFAQWVKPKYFWPWSFIVMLMAFVIQDIFLLEFKDMGPWYSAFIQNLIMSFLFINLLITRGNTKGQNITIACSKWLGTLAVTILGGVIYGNQLVLILGIFCSVFDIIYICLLSERIS